jgi:hypothetical protein
MPERKEILRFHELKTIADIRERYDHLMNKSAELRGQADGIIVQKKASIVISVLNDFEQYFTQQGFQVKTRDQEAVAAYKTVTVTLSIQEPGRREEDIPCLIRFKLTLAASDPEVFSIFVKWQQPGSETVPVEHNHHSGSNSASGNIITAIHQLSALTGELQNFAQQTSLSFQVDSHLDVLEQLHSDISTLLASLENEMGKWKALEAERYVFTVRKGMEEWSTHDNPEFQSMGDLLEHVNSTA